MWKAAWLYNVDNIWQKDLKNKVAGEARQSCTYLNSHLTDFFNICCRFYFALVKEREKITCSVIFVCEMLCTKIYLEGTFNWACSSREAVIRFNFLYCSPVADLNRILKVYVDKSVCPFFLTRPLLHTWIVTLNVNSFTLTVYFQQKIRE